MKLFLIAFAVIAAVAADVSHLPANDYLPPVQESVASEPIQEYLPPAQAEEAAPAHELAADGYRYKTQRRVVLRRNRRDVSHLPSNEYLPPGQEEGQVGESAHVEQLSLPVEEPAPAHELADDGYRYKTLRRVVYRRNRRDVSHLPSNEYLPPGQEQQQSAPVQAFEANQATQIVEEPIVANVQEDAEPAHELADDGYRYKTHRRVVYRRTRRDVSHLPSSEYLPPGQEHAAASAPVHESQAALAIAPGNEYLPPVQQDAAPAHELADDGYRYKTNRRVVYRRHRRDVSHLPSNDYLPPAQGGEEVESAPIEEIAVAVEEAAPAHELADDGYRYKTHRRVVYRRNRRDVSHLPSNEYLPPGQEQQQSAPVQAFEANQATQIVEEPIIANVQEEAEPAHELADDGYRYKTHRRVVYRRTRRDVSHLPSSEYLPPGQEQASAPVQAFQSASASAPSNEYLPPGQQSAPVAAVEDAAPAHELADDGYRYKTQRRVVYRRHRRDVSHLPSNDYLPPAQGGEEVQSAPIEEIAVAVEEAAPAHELADDGYRYKTQRRVVYRRH